MKLLLFIGGVVLSATIIWISLDSPVESSIEINDVPALTTGNTENELTSSQKTTPRVMEAQDPNVLYSQDVLEKSRDDKPVHIGENLSAEDYFQNAVEDSNEQPMHIGDDVTLEMVAQEIDAPEHIGHDVPVDTAHLINDKEQKDVGEKLFVDEYLLDPNHPVFNKNDESKKANTDSN